MINKKIEKIINKLHTRSNKSTKMNFEFECKPENDIHPTEAFIATFSFETNDNIEINYNFDFGMDKKEEGYIIYGLDEEYSWNDFINGKTIKLCTDKNNTTNTVNFSIEEEYFNFKFEGGIDWIARNNLRIKITSEMREKIISEFEKCKKYFE